MALTRAGRALYDELAAESAGVWAARFPRTDHELALERLAFFTYEPVAVDPSLARALHALDLPEDLV